MYLIKGKLSNFLVFSLISQVVFSASQPAKQPAVDYRYNASNFRSLFDVKQYHILTTFTIGPDFVNAGQAQTLTLLPPFQNYYTNTSGTQTVADAGAFFGIERELTDKLWVQFGVSGYIDEEMSPQGVVWQFGLPEFADLSYVYHVKHARVMFESKVLTRLALSALRLRPYFSYALGTAYNQAYNYEEQVIEAGAVPTPSFGNAHQSSFTWAVGVGFENQYSEHIRLGIGYQFADFGSVTLGPTTAATSRLVTLSFPHLYANQLRFQFTFLV